MHCTREANLYLKHIEPRIMKIDTMFDNFKHFVGGNRGEIKQF